MTFLGRAVILLVALVLLPAGALAERKYALVVGIDTYAHVKKLSKAREDAKSIAKAFEEIGFDSVILKTDLDRREFNQVWSDFLAPIKKGDTVAFFFSGHGIELSGQNFLVPKDIPKLQADRFEQLRRESLSLQEFMSDLRKKEPRFSLIIIDACRENPFDKLAFRALGTEAGLANPQPPEGTFTMYSAAQGEFALDRLSESDNDPNSIYTRRLLPLLRTPGLTLTDIASNVRSEVKDLADTIRHRQTPAYFDQLFGKACLFGTTCGGAAVEEAKSVAAGRRLAANQDYNLAISKHFKPLAEQGNVEAAVELWKLYDKLEDRGRMLDWLEKAAGLGDKEAAIDLAWANARESIIERVPREWQSKLNQAEAKVQAEALIKSGEDEGALILYVLDQDRRNETDSALAAPAEGAARELPGDASLREAAERGFAPAMVKYAEVLASSLSSDAGKPAPGDKEKAERAMELFARAARKGNARALYDLIFNNTSISEEVFKAFDLKMGLSDAEVAGLLPGGARGEFGKGTFDRIRSSENAVPSIWETRSLAVELARRQLEGIGFTPDAAAALQTITDVVEPLVVREAQENAEGGVDVDTLYRIKGRALAALGDQDKALGYFLGIAEEYQTYGQHYDVWSAVQLLDEGGWNAAREGEVAKAYADTCALDSVVDDPSHKDNLDYKCYAATRSLIFGGRKATFGVIKKAMDDYFKPSYGDAPPDDARKALILYLKAKMAEADPSVLAAGETLDKLMTRAASLGSADAVAWFTAQGLAPPKVRAQLEYVRIAGPSSNWEAGQRLENKSALACYLTTVKDGVATPAGSVERKPKLGVLSQEQDGWGIGSVFYDTDIEGAVPASVKVFLDAVEYKSTVSLTRRRLIFTGDQKALVKKLAASSDIRIEFKAGPHAVRDTHSLIGFTDIYKDMAGACPKVKSAL